MTALTKTSRTGQRIEVKIEQARAVLYLDGQKVAGPTAPLKLAKPQGDVTHWLGDSDKRQAVGLTTAEAQTVKTALRPPVKRERVDPATTWMGEASMDDKDSIF